MSNLQKAITHFKSGQPSELSDAVALGIMISQHFRWQGEEIVQTMCEALTDANYHSLVEAIKIEWEKW